MSFLIICSYLEDKIMASFGELYFYLYFELVTVYKSYYIYDHTLNQWF